MEKSVDTAALPIFSAIRETFDIRKGDIRTYSPLTLAYIGDGIYDLVIRSMIVAQGNTKASQLHNHTSHLVKAHSQSAMMEYLMPVLSFMFGVAAATEIRQHFQNIGRIHWRQIVILIEMSMLFLVGFLPGKMDLVANAFVSFSCAMQVQTFRKVDSYAFASTMCIGNIRSGMEALCAYRQSHNRQILYKAFHYFGIIILFAFGAGIGSILIPVFTLQTIWFSSFLLMVGFFLMFIQEK